VKEGIAARVGRIISGGFNQIIDAVENTAPVAVMEQAIREVDGAIDEVRAELGRVLANKHLASKRLMDASSRHEELTSQLELALKQNREDLAQAAIAKQLDLEAQIPVLETTIKECSEQEKELEGYVQALLAKKREMKEDLIQFRRTQQQAAVAVTAAPGADGTARSSTIQSKVAKAEGAFDRVIERQTGLARGDFDLKSGSQLAELEDLSRKHRIEERLAAAKARMQNP
jgi:phage shock protein A